MVQGKGAFFRGQRVPGSELRRWHYWLYNTTSSSSSQSVLVCVLCSSAQLCVRSCLYPSFSREKPSKVWRTFRDEYAPNGLISDSFSLSVCCCSCCSEYARFVWSSFQQIYIHSAQSEASSSSSSNLLLRCELLFGRRTENVYDAERTQRRQRSKRKWKA